MLRVQRYAQDSRRAVPAAEGDDRVRQIDAPQGAHHGCRPRKIRAPDPQQAFSGDEFLCLALRAGQSGQAELVEQLETQDRAGTRAARHEPDRAERAEPEGLYGHARVLLFPSDVRSRYHLAPQARQGRLPHPAGRALPHRQHFVRFSGQVPRTDHPARHRQYADPSGPGFRHRGARPRAGARHGFPQGARLLQLYGQQHRLCRRHARRKPSGRCAGQYQAVSYGLQRTRTGRDGQQHGLPHRPDQRLSGVRSDRRADRFDLSFAARYALLPRSEHHLREASEPASGHSASVGAALSQLRLQLGAGEPRLYRPDVARLFQERQDRLRRAAPERRCHQLRLFHRRFGGFHADPLYEGGLSGVQHFVHPGAQAEFQGRSRRQYDVEFLRTEGYRRLPEPQHLPGSGGAGRFVYGGIRVYEGARRQEKARHGIRRYHRTHLPAFSGAVAYAAVPFGEPAKDQGGAFGQFSGPPLLSAYAFECGNHLPVDQQPLLFVLAAARRYQRRRCESAGLDLPRQDDE